MCVTFRSTFKSPIDPPSPETVIVEVIVLRSGIVTGTCVESSFDSTDVSSTPLLFKSSNTVQPAKPGSPLSCTPSLFKSLNTFPEIEDPSSPLTTRFAAGSPNP